MLTRNLTLAFFALAFVAGGLCILPPTQARASGPSSSATPTPTPTPDDEVIKIESDVVNVLFTAQDKNRRLLTDLKQSDVVLFEDGKQQELTSFSRQIDLPLSLAILVEIG